MLKRIEKPKVRKRFFDRMKIADSKVLYLEHNRNVKLKDGSNKTITYQMKPHELQRSNAQNVFTTLLNWYTDHYNKMYAVMPDAWGDGNYPTLKTTNGEIAHSAGCSARTVSSTIKKLSDLGVLTKKFNGTRAGIGIQFSESILWGETPEEKSQALPTNVVPFDLLRKKFPDNNSTKDIIENETNAEFSFFTIERIEDRERGQQIALSGAEMTPNELIDPLLKEQTLAAAVEANVDNSVEMVENSEPNVDLPSRRHTKSERDAYRKRRASDNEKVRLLQLEKETKEFDLWNEQCKQAVMYFWAVSYEKLYADRKFDAQDVNKILHLIWTDVFHSFKFIYNPKQLADFMTRALTKIEKAAKYYDYHPEAYLPDPHDIVVKGKGYFSKENTRGYLGLEAWLKKDEGVKRIDILEPKAHRERKTNRLLVTARHDFEKIRAGATPRVEVMHLDFLGLMQFYTIVFQNLGGDAFQRFNTQILQQQKCDFKAFKKPKYDKNAIVIEVDDFMNSFGNSYYSEI